MSMDPPTATDPAQTASPFADGVSLGQQLAYAPIVVAVNDGVEAAGPVRVASALERRFGSRVSAIEVMDTSSLALPTPLPSAFTYARELIGDEPYAEDARARRGQFTAWLGEPNEWPVRIAVGTVAPEILRWAEHEGAALIVMGLRHHGLVDRVLRDETTLTVARRARAVVLGVTPSLRGLPRRVVVGVDFGPASIRAARAALDIMEPGTPADRSVLRLVYVDRNGLDGAHEDTAGEVVIREFGVATAFERLIRELNAPPTVDVETVVRRGPVADELLAVVDASRADLIVVGSLRHERIERWILGSVTTEVVRDGRCSVLVIPPSPPAA